MNDGYAIMPISIPLSVWYTLQAEVIVPLLPSVPPLTWLVAQHHRLITHHANHYARCHSLSVILSSERMNPRSSENAGTGSNIPAKPFLI